MSIPRWELRPGYSISRLIKGGWQLAGGHGSVDEARARDDMARFVDAGLTTFDCADIYTGVEALIGRFIAGRRRLYGESATPIQVHTKYVPDLASLATLTREGVVRAIDRSLTRLGVDRVDLVQFHWWDYDEPRYLDTALWLSELQRAGKIRHVAATNFDTPRLGELIEAGVPIVSHQVQYSVIDRRPVSDMTSFCHGRNILLLCHGALAGGFLSHRWLDRPAPAAPHENRSLTKYALIIDEFGGWARFQALLRRLTEIGRDHGVGPGAVAVRAVLQRPQVAGVIVGARSAAHVAELEAMARLDLSAAELASIEELSASGEGPSGDVYGLERIKGGRHAAVMRYNLNSKAADQ